MIPFNFFMILQGIDYKVLVQMKTWLGIVGLSLVILVQVQIIIEFVILKCLVITGRVNVMV